ncbi:SurA N-terminal domain-containing protein [Desulfoplanes sp.]
MGPRGLKTMGYLLCSLVCVMVWSQSVRADELVDRIVAVVNGEIITLFDVDQQLTGYTRQFDGRSMTAKEKKTLQVLRKRVLGQMVNDLLLEAEAVRLEMTVTDVEVKNQVESFKNQHDLTEEEFLDQLKLQGMTRGDYEEKTKKDIMRQRLIGAMVRRKVVVTDSEMRNYYKEHKGDFSREKKISLALILVDAGVDLQSLRGRIMAGDISFGQAAEKYSIGPGAKQGGELGEVRWADMRPSWKDALRGLGKGDTTQPFALGTDMALLRILEFTAGTAVPFEDVKAKIREILYRPRIEKRFNEYMEGLKDKAVVDIRM